MEAVQNLPAYQQQEFMKHLEQVRYTRLENLSVTVELMMSDEEWQWSNCKPKINLKWILFLVYLSPLFGSLIGDHYQHNRRCNWRTAWQCTMGWSNGVSRDVYRRSVRRRWTSQRSPAWNIVPDGTSRWPNASACVSQNTKPCNRRRPPRLPWQQVDASYRFSVCHLGWKQKHTDQVR